MAADCRTRKAPRHEVEVAAHRGLADPQRARRFRRIPDLAVIVGEHAPEAADGERTRAESKLRKVALDGELHEGFAPPEAVFVGRGRERQREPAARPKARSRRRCRLRRAPADRLRSLPAGPPGTRSTACRSCGEALPRSRYCPGRSSRSIRTRRIGKRSGRRWTSSMTTSPVPWRLSSAVIAGPQPLQVARALEVEVAGRLVPATGCARAWSCPPGAARPMRQPDCVPARAGWRRRVRNGRSCACHGLELTMKFHP